MTRLTIALTLTLALSSVIGCAPAEEEPALEPDDRMDVALIQNAIDDIRRQAENKDMQDPDPVGSSPVGKLDTTDAPPSKPPEGASAYPRLDEKATISVESKAGRLKRSQPKASSDSSAAPGAPRPSIELGFSGQTITPPSGVDPRLLKARESIDDREFTYGFLILNEYLSAEVEDDLGSLGVTIIGPHADAHKARIPIDPAVMQTIADRPYVDWLGYPEPGQKLDPLATRARRQFKNELKELPVFVNFFDAEAGERYGSALRGRDIVLGRYDPDLDAYPAVVPMGQMDWLLERDYVLFVEFERGDGPGHDQSMSAMGVDYIRTGGPGTNFSGATTILGIMDTGFMVGSAAPTMHQDLNKNGCGRNFTSDAAGVWNDENSHGTHVLGTIIGTGTGDSRNRGVAMGVGNRGNRRIRAAKIWNSAGSSSSSSAMRDAMDYLDNDSSCDSGKPKVVNISGGATGTGQVGTDARSRKLDQKIWRHKQSYIVCGGNSGSNAQTIWSPGVAKNSLAVGNALDNGFQTVGDINNGSSRGPAGDGRMKPNVVGTGTTVTSTRAGTTDQYSNKNGCSMATPHVSGIAATLLQHYSDFRDRPHLLRAHLMATAILHDDIVTPRNNNSGGRNTYGLGRVSTYVAHWARSNSNGWNTWWATRNITRNQWGFRDINVPSGTDRLVAVLTWDEPAASSGASKAVDNDIDLWIDWQADCTPDSKGQCGEWASQSWDDNVEYLIIDNPPAGTYRLKMVNWDAPSGGVPVAIVATVIRGDPTPTMRLATSVSPSTPAVGATVTVTTTVTNPSYIASGVYLERTNLPAGLTFQDVRTTREDGITMDFTASNLTLGNIVQGDSRSAQWRFTVTAPGTKTVDFRAWSENGGMQTTSATIN